MMKTTINYNILVCNVDKRKSSDSNIRMRENKEVFENMAKAHVGNSLDIHMDKGLLTWEEV